MGLLAKLVIPSALVLAAVASVFFADDLRGQINGSDSPVEITCDDVMNDANSDRSVDDRVTISDYRGPLAPGTSPAVWVPKYPVIVHARISEQSASQCSTTDGTVDGPPFVSTDRTAEVLEAIKGDPPAQLALTTLGGTLNGFVTEVEGLVGSGDLVPGDDAVLFLTPQGNKWMVENIYVIESGIARSELDLIELPADDLIQQLREAVAAETGSD